VDASSFIVKVQVSGAILNVGLESMCSGGN